MMDATRKRGRPRSLTDSQRKKKRKELEKRRMEQRISVGEQIGNWNDLRGVLDCKSNEELVEVLISHL